MSMITLVTSKKTVLSGLLAALWWIIPEVFKSFDGSVDTVTDWNKVIPVVIAFFVALFARDNNVSDEEAGIPPSRATASRYYALHQDTSLTNVDDVA